jgi:inosine-uridine nucleoside N-ribohydrolase
MHWLTSRTTVAGHHPTLRLLGISTVAGNQSLSKVTQNALDMLDAAGLQHIGEEQGDEQHGVCTLMPIDAIDAQ